MKLCNNLLSYIIQYLDIRTLCIILLYIPSIKDEIGKQYCINRQIFKSSYNITNYADTLLYFQNNYIYRCYHCGQVLRTSYYLIICPCIINILDVNIVYTKYHIECLDEIYKTCSNTPGNIRSSRNNKIKIIKCQFCNNPRMCFLCNLYS